VRATRSPLTTPMTTEPTETDVDALLAQHRWLARLAGRLVRGAGADDLAQETLVRALEASPGGPPSRGWLARIAQRERAHGARRERARREREVRAARGEATGSTLDALERIATQRELARLVLELPPAQREVIALRFWDDLPPRRIAQRLGLDVEAVKSRLKRAIATLRSRLDAENGGDRSQWLSSLASLVVPTGGPVAHAVEAVRARASETLAAPLRATPQLIGTALVSTAILKIAVPVLLVSGVIYVTGAPGGDDSSVGAHGGDRAADASDEGPALVGVDGVAHDRRQASPGAAASADERSGEDAPSEPGADSVAPGAVEYVLVGRLVSLDGDPLAGVPVGDLAAGEPPSSAAVSGADGSFELPATPGVRGGAVADGWTTVFAAQRTPARLQAVSLAVAAPAVSLGGQVVDRWGVPVEGATVSVAIPEDIRTTSPNDLDHSVPQEWSAETDAGGAFALQRAPRVDGAVLRARADGHPSYEAPAPGIDRTDLVVVLSGPEDGDGLLSGLVVDEGGVAVPAATVSYGLETTASGPDGRFVLALSDAEGMNTRAARFLGDAVQPGEIVAFAAGHRTGRVRASLDDEGAPRWPESVVIELAGAPLSIEGTVLRADGTPVADAEVWLDDATLMGFANGELSVLEGTQGETPGGRTSTTTDSEGRFRLTGLEDRPYRVVAMDGETLLRVGPVPVPAGTEDAVLELPDLATWETLRGRVVDREGEPVEDVTVAVTTDTERLTFRDQTVSTRHARRDDPSVTGADGHFEFAVVPRRAVYLRLDGPGIVPLEWGRTEFALEELLDDPARVEIVVGLRRRFRVELADPGSADEVAVLDGDGQVLQLSLMVGNGRRDGGRMNLVDGESGVLTVGDSAATLVLYLDGEEVQRTPLEFDGGDVTVVEM